MVRTFKNHIGLIPSIALSFIAYTSLIVGTYALLNGGYVNSSSDAGLLLAIGLAATCIDFTVDRIA